MLDHQEFFRSFAWVYGHDGGRHTLQVTNSAMYIGIIFLLKIVTNTKNSHLIRRKQIKIPPCCWSTQLSCHSFVYGLSLGLHQLQPFNLGLWATNASIGYGLTTLWLKHCLLIILWSMHAVASECNSDMCQAKVNFSSHVLRMKMVRLIVHY